MPSVTLFKHADLQFEPMGEDVARAAIARLVGSGMSQTMGAGIARFDGASIAWTVRYDEVIVVLKGRFCLRIDGVAHYGAPGDVMWIPAGTPLHYEGDAAEVFYVLYPVDWRERQPA